MLLTACEGKLSNKIMCIKQIQTKMKDAFEGEESKGDLDMISSLIVWIYQTEDVEKLEQMLQLAMASGLTTSEANSPDKIPGPDQPSQDQITDLSTSVTTPALGGN